jgi:group I intron endonuclease
MFIYLIYNLKTNKVYIGKTVKTIKRRWQEHRASAKHVGQSQYLLRSMNKYGEDAFVILKLDMAKTNEELCEKEKKYIAELNTRNPEYGYNLTDGGEGVCGLIVSEKSRQKMREARAKYQLSPETYAKAAASRRGRKLAPEHCRRIALGQAGREPPSKETREKMRTAKLGKKRPPRSAEYCANIAAAKMGHTVSPEARAKISANLKIYNQKRKEEQTRCQMQP